VDQGLCDPSSKVCSGTIDLREILSRESTTTVGPPSTVCVDDNLTAGKTGITLRTTNDEESRWLNLKLLLVWHIPMYVSGTYVVDGLVVQVLCRDDLLDDLLLDLFS
jgi:hypothetical protein